MEEEYRGVGKRGSVTFLLKWKNLKWSMRRKYGFSKIIFKNIYSVVYFYFFRILNYKKFMKVIVVNLCVIFKDIFSLL